MKIIKNLLNSNNFKMKSNICFYCAKRIDERKRHFCSEVCNQKYWYGVYAKRWKEGDSPVNRGCYPTIDELNRYKERSLARQLGYKKYKKNTILQCDICKIKTKDINRLLPENYVKPEIFMCVCNKCHGLIKRYNNLKDIFYSLNIEDEKTSKTITRRNKDNEC